LRKPLSHRRPDWIVGRREREREKERGQGAQKVESDVACVRSSKSYFKPNVISVQITDAL
jgi:hypothetical protein